MREKQDKTKRDQIAFAKVQGKKRVSAINWQAAPTGLGHGIRQIEAAAAVAPLNPIATDHGTALPLMSVRLNQG